MASSCAQMCLQCRRFLFSRITVCAWASINFGHCSSSTWMTKTATQLLNRSLIGKGSLTTARGKEKWRQGLICVSNLTAKHLSERVKDSERFSRANAAAFSSPLSPIRDAHQPDQIDLSLGVSNLLLLIKISSSNNISAYIQIIDTINVYSLPRSYCR